MKYTLLLALSAVAAIAGPPLICHPIDIGNAQSLPWKDLKNWNRADPHYDANAHLLHDTLAILTPSTPLPVRMETLRRAAIYAAKSDTTAESLTSRLVARIADSEAAGAKADPGVWFDAGYYVEALRQIGFIYRYNMLSAAERAYWKVRGENPGLDGKPWIDQAIRLGGKGMEVALVKIEEFRQADLRRPQVSKR